MCKSRVLSHQYVTLLGLNTETHRENPCIQSVHGENGSEKNSMLRPFLHNDCLMVLLFSWFFNLNKFFLWISRCVKSVCIRSYSGPYFPNLDWIWRDIPYFSVFSLNAGKYGPEYNSECGHFLCMAIIRNITCSESWLSPQQVTAWHLPPPSQFFFIPLLQI